jgi:chromosome segregation ATPase
MRSGGGHKHALTLKGISPVSSSSSGALDTRDTSLVQGTLESQPDADLMKRERARADLLLRRLEEQRTYHEERYHDLRQRYERTISERTQLRQTLYGMGQNQETLDLTCRELSQELDQTRREVNDLKRDLKAQEKMSNAIDQVTQQKQAWRAKALALEERVQTNQQLSVQLKELGMESLELQVRLFQTLLTTPESASQLFHAIKMVEHDEVKTMVERWVVQTCAHPLCQQINQLSRKLSLRVDRPSQCQVCGGNAEVRWFKRMTASCERSHIRRFLLVGGEEIHTRIRELSEGQAVDFRLISSRDESSDQRIYSRLENCDLLVSWPHDSISMSVGDQYRSIAPRAGAHSLEIPGTKVELTKLTRLILNWVNRTGGRP